MTLSSTGSGGGGRGGHGPPGPVKISHKKDGCRRRLLKFHVSRPPPPLPDRWIRYCRLCANLHNAINPTGADHHRDRTAYHQQLHRQLHQQLPCVERTAPFTLNETISKIHLHRVTFICYRPQPSWGKVMFSQECMILFTGGGLPQCMLGYPPKTRHPPGGDTPLGADTHQADCPPPEQTRPRHRACWEIRSTRGWYAFYWNAILFCFHLRFCSVWVGHKHRSRQNDCEYIRCK